MNLNRNGLFSTINFLEIRDYERIHTASLKILAETGVVFQNNEAVELFKKYGARVDGRRVYITSEMVEEAISSLVRTYKFNGRNPKQDITVGEDFCIQPNAGAVYIQDIDNGRRLATIEDYGNMMKLAHASDIINMVGAHPLNPSDVSDKYKHLYMCYETLKHSDKPVLGWAMAGQQAKEYLDMIQIAMGEIPGSSTDKQYANFSANPLSPLAWGEDTLESMMEYSKRGQGVYLLPCIMAGITGPMNHLGTMVLQNTEILSGIVFCYLVNPATPIVYSPSSTTGNMKKASYVTGTPDMMMINAPLLMMAHDYYQMPTRCMCGMTDAKTPDMQAGIETMQNVLLAVLSGVDIINECLGVLDAIMTVSYEKHIIDEEIIKRCLYIKNGIDTTDEALSVEVIQEVGPEDTYLTHPNTFKNFKDVFANSISECESYEVWINNGALDIVKRANVRFKEILAMAPETLLDHDTDKALRAYMEKIMT